MEREKRTRLLAILGLTMLLSSFFVMFSVFMTAYMSPTKTALVHVNLFNEAPLELALLMSTSVLGLYAFVILLRDFRNLGRI